VVQCRVCDAVWPDTSRFCGSCGTSLDAPEPSAPAAASWVAPWEEDDDPTIAAPTTAVPTASVYPAAVAGPTQPAIPRGPVTTGPAITRRAVLALFGGIGVIVASLLDWTRGASANSFKVPAAYLFSYKTTSENPKTGYFLIVVGAICILTSFVRTNGPILVLAGAGAGAGGVLYMVQSNILFDKLGAGARFTDFVGPGAWVLVISGAVLIISPLVAPRDVARGAPFSPNPGLAEAPGGAS
jgi:hypothetical protein